METILFVCTSNTCRSPMAAAFFNQLVPGDLNLKAYSAGMYTSGNVAPPSYAVVAAAELGVDISAHRSSMLSEKTGDHAKKIICVTAAHRDRLLEKYPQWRDKTFCLSSKDISDPFGGTLELYRKAAKQLYDAIENIIGEGMPHGA